MPFWPSMACRWRCPSIQVRIKDLPVRLGEVGSFLAHFCTWAILTGSLDSLGSKLDLQKQIWMNKENYFQVLPQATPFLPPRGISMPFPASASKPHTWCLGDRRTAHTPCSELAKRRGWGQPWPSSTSSERISADLGSVALDLVQCRREPGQAACQRLSEELGWFRWDGLTGVSMMQNWCY